MFLIISLNIWLTNGLPIVDYDDGNQVYSCQHTMKFKQIFQLLNQQPCVQIIQKENQRIMKRNTDAGNVDIHAMQTTINDQRTMINYLINNSMNATFYPLHQLQKFIK